MNKIGLALHGGAISKFDQDFQIAEEFLLTLVKSGREMLMQGQHCADVACKLTVALEDSGLFCAGKGSSPNRAGKFELDAILISGCDRMIGAVAGLVGFKNPIIAAQMIALKTPHVILTGEGAREFANQFILENSVPNKDYFTPVLEWGPEDGELAHGTVGVVCKDINSNLAASTSTGGVLNKLPGRVGDSPIIGAGTWADDDIALSCTGQGEYFLKTGFSRYISTLVAETDYSIEDAISKALLQVHELGGEGGVIALDKSGQAYIRCNSPGIKAAWLDENMKPTAMTYA